MNEPAHGSNRSDAGIRVVRWVILALVVVGIVAAQVWRGNRHHYFDLEIYRQAVNWWLHGHDLYTFTKPDDTQGQLGFTYPPFGALVLVPFAVLPHGLAILLYAVLTLGAFFVTTLWLVRPAVRRHGWSLPFVMVLALAVFSALEPMRETYTFGQINMILIVLILVDLLVLVPKASKWAGICIGLAAAIKLTPAIFIVYLLVSRRRRAALTAVASAAGVTLLSAAIAPRASWAYWTDTLWRGEGLGNAAYTANQSIYAMLARFSQPDPPNRPLWAVLVLIAVVYGLWRARRALLAGDEVTGLTLTGIVGSLASPITWLHHLYWFVPALVVLVDVAFAKDRPAMVRRLFGVLAFVMLVLVALGAVSWFEVGLPVHPWGDGVQGFLIHNCYLLFCVLLLVVLPVRTRAEAEPAAVPAGDAAMEEDESADAATDTPTGNGAAVR
jgi:alpha-1,2-mannosyltransferase